jgi:hypothetical protein
MFKSLHNQVKVLWYSEEIPLKPPAHTPLSDAAPLAETPNDLEVLNWLFGTKPTPPSPPPNQDEQNEPKYVLVPALDHEIRPLKRRRQSHPDRV